MAEPRIDEAGLPVYAPGDYDYVRVVDRSTGASRNALAPEVTAAARALSDALDGLVDDARAGIDELIAGLGYLAPVPYDTGLDVEDIKFTVSYNGDVYAPKPELVPFTTGAWDSDQWNVIQGDINLRSDLSDPAGGGALVAYDEDSSVRDAIAHRESGRTLTSKGAANTPAVFEEAKTLGTAVYATGKVDLLGGIRVGTVGLHGAGGQHTGEAQRIRLLAGGEPIELGWGDIPWPRPVGAEHTGHYANLIGITISSQINDGPAVVATECHFNKWDRVSVRNNNLQAGVPLVKLNATLYNRVIDSDFGHGYGDGIRGIESQYDVTYYGVNASWFARNNFNGEGTAAHLHGIFSFRDSTIENTSSTAPKLRIGETGKSSSAKVVIDHVYFETETKAGEPVIHPPIQIDSQSAVSIYDCVIGSANNHYHSLWDGTNGPSIKATTAQNYGSIRNNNLNPGSLNLANGWVKGVDWILANDSYVEFVNNQWYSTVNLRFFVDGVDMHTRATVPAANSGRRVYIRDRQHGELKQNIPERNVWVDHNAGQSLDWRIDGGKHLVVQTPSAGDVQISRRNDWKGLRFTVHFRQAVPLKHGNDYFLLAKGSDVTIPAGWVLDFVIDYQGRVREVGAATMQL